MTETATELRAQLAEIDEETTVLQSKLQLLAEERQSVLRRLDAVVYPVLILPSDITAEIFMHYSFPDITYAFSREAHPPLLLASVCRTWRVVALSFPRLWTSLRLNRYSETATRREQLLQCWLPRAGGCLIDLGIPGHLTPSMCDTIAQYAPQLRSLVYAPSGSQLSLAIQRSRQCFAALKTLTVEFGWKFDGITITSFSDAPQLREVHIARGSLSFIKLPWNQLTTLDLSRLFPSLEVLKQTINLEVLSFSHMLPLPDSEEEEALVLPKLHTLKIDPTSTSSSNCDLLYDLTLPALRTLELGYRSDIEPLRSLISRSSCALQTMHLYDRTAGETIECLELSESLEYLTLEFTEEWVGRFIEEEEDSEREKEYAFLFHFLCRGTLPALKSLSFHEYPMHMEALLLDSMLKSRCEVHGVTKLESFQLVFDHPAQRYSEDHAYNLRSLVAHGLNIHIEWAATGRSAWNLNVSPELVAEL